MLINLIFVSEHFINVDTIPHHWYRSALHLELFVTKTRKTNAYFFLKRGKKFWKKLVATQPHNCEYCAKLFVQSLFGPQI